MDYKRLGSTELRVSQLGFGCIKFRQCTQEEVTAALHRALDVGINFFDTARAYADSEEKIGRAIASRRSDYVLATKSSAREEQGILADIETSLRNLQTDTIDVLFLHSVSDLEAYELVMAPGGAVEGAHKARQQGKIRHIGASIHRDLATARRAIDSGAFEVIMVAYSVLDPEGSGALLSEAVAAGMGTVVMKPLSGGQLVSPPGADGRPIEPDPLVQGSLRWVISNPDVSTVIPGMISARQVEHNLAAVEQGPLTESEREDLIAGIGALGQSYRYGQRCLRCGYCLPCPQGIDIPAVFHAAAMAEKYPDSLKHMGRDLFEEQTYRARDCKECGQCAEHCPAGIDIPQRLREVEELFSR